MTVASVLTDAGVVDGELGSYVGVALAFVGPWLIKWGLRLMVQRQRVKASGGFIMSRKQAREYYGE